MLADVLPGASQQSRFCVGHVGCVCGFAWPLPQLIRCDAGAACFISPIALHGCGWLGFLFLGGVFGWLCRRYGLLSELAVGALRDTSLAHVGVWWAVCWALWRLVRMACADMAGNWPGLVLVFLCALGLVVAAIQQPNSLALRGDAHTFCGREAATHVSCTGAVRVLVSSVYFF